MESSQWKHSDHPNDGKASYGGAEGASVRDVVGYGGSPPHVHWPNGAKVAINLVVNYEGTRYSVCVLCVVLVANLNPRKLYNCAM